VPGRAFAIPSPGSGARITCQVALALCRTHNDLVPTPDTRRRLSRRLRKSHLDVPPDVIEGLIVYYELLRHWNSRINLTALPEGDEAIDRLLIEPLLAAPYLPEAGSLLIDVGSGGGSPAVPLKVAQPALQLWMVESKVRKSAFLREVVRELGLASTHVETGRFEEVVLRPELFGLADALSVRAVRTDLKTLSSLQRALRAGGDLLLFTRFGVTSGLLLPPQLVFVGEEPLVATLQSALVRLRKQEGVAWWQ
jgi:16S rRNA (guanine527-N7)-methyltransferase